MATTRSSKRGFERRNRLASAPSMMSRPEIVGEEPREALIADRLDVAQIDRQRRDADAEGRARLEPLRHRCHDVRPAAPAGPAMAFDPRHHRFHRRQLDLVVALDEMLLCLAHRRAAVRAARKLRDHHLVGIGMQWPPATRTPHARLAPEPARSPPPVRLAVVRRRHARIAGILRRLAEPRLQRRHPLGQRQHQFDQLVIAKPGQIIASHPILESRRDSRVNQYLVVDRPLNHYQAHSDPPG